MAILSFLIGIMLPFFIRYIVTFKFDKLEDERFVSKYGILYEEYKIKSKSMAGYGFYMIFRRMILIMILVDMALLPDIQTKIIIMLSLLNLM